MASYKEAKETIEIFRLKDNEGKYSWRAKKGWTREKRDELVKPFTENHADKIGIVLGRYYVFDLDHNHGNNANGTKTFGNYLSNKYFDDKEMYQQVIDDIKNTMRVRTPKGGLHIWFEIPKEIKENDCKRKVNWINGVDLLTNDRCFAPAPNTTREDGQYKIDEGSSDEISIAPSWVVDIFNQTKNTFYQALEEDGYAKKNDNLKRVNNKGKMYQYIETMMNGFEQGNRDNGIYKLSASVVKLVQEEIMDEDVAQFIVKTTAENCKPPFKEWGAKWNSAVDRANEELYKRVQKYEKKQKEV